MKIVSCGDSWAWGSELLDPSVTPYKGTLVDHNEHYKPLNTEWRLKHRYANLLAEKLNAELVDLSLCSFSNESIVRTLLRWLAVNEYMSGKDTSDLLVIIGWTSPERREHLYSGIGYEKVGNEVPGIPGANLEPWSFIGPWALDVQYPHHDKRMKEFMRLYVELFWDLKEYILRYYSSVILIQNLLKNLKIKHVMYQAFYHNTNSGIRQWKTDQYKDNVLNEAYPHDLKIWESVNSETFLLKNSNTPTFKDYILNLEGGIHDKVFYSWHPNELGHKYWAEFLYKELTEKKFI